MAAAALSSSCLAMALGLLLLTVPVAMSDDIAVTPSAMQQGAGSPLAAGPAASASCREGCKGWTAVFCDVKCYISGPSSSAGAPAASPADAPATA